MSVSFFRRFVPIAATVTLSSGLLVGGVGAASADKAGGPIVFDSPSSLTVGRDDSGELEVSYDNQSGQSLLMCNLTLSTTEVVDAMLDHLEAVEPGDSQTAETPQHIKDLISEAEHAGRHFSGLLVAQGPGLTEPSSGIELIDPDFMPAGMTICQGGDFGNEGFAGNGYFEVEVYNVPEGEDGGAVEPPVPAPAPVFDSPSVFGFHRDPISGGYYFSYDNKSGYDLWCTVHISTKERTAAHLAHLETAELTMDDVLAMPISGDGYHRAGWFNAPADETRSTAGIMNPEPLREDFMPEAITLCVDIETDGGEFVDFPGEHLEIEHAVLTGEAVDVVEVDDDDDNEDDGPAPVAGPLEQLPDLIDVFGSLGDN